MAPRRKTNYKQNLEKQQRQNELIAERIQGRIKARRIVLKDFLDAVQIKPSTFYLRINDPGSFRLDELRAIYRVLEIDDEDPARRNVL